MLAIVVVAIFISLIIFTPKDKKTITGAIAIHFYGFLVGCAFGIYLQYINLNEKVIVTGANMDSGILMRLLLPFVVITVISYHLIETKNK